MESEDTACAQLTFDGESSSHGFRNVFGQRQSQTGSVNLGSANRRTAVKRLENLRQFRSSDANTAVLNANANLLAIPAMRLVYGSAHTDPTALTTVLYRIHNQILQPLGKGRNIPSDVRQIWIDPLLDYEPGASRQFRGVFNHRSHDLLNFYRTQVIADLSLLGGGKQQNLVDQFSDLEIGRAHVLTPVTDVSRMPSSA